MFDIWKVSSVLSYLLKLSFWLALISTLASMKPDLVICIPTYNRVRELRHLLESFVYPLLKQYASRLHVLIADNSDIQLQDLNRLNIRNNVSITYHANSSNLGYGGNILTLLELARPLGRYLWFLSDDDDVNIPMFHDFMTLLSADTYSVALYVFGYHLKSSLNVATTSILPQSHVASYTTFDKVVVECQKVLPFLLISSFALETKYITDSVLCSMRQHCNDFAHISLLGLSLGANEIACTSRLCPIVYNDVDGYPRIELDSVFWGYTQALDSFDFLSEKDKKRLNKNFLRGLLYQVLRFKDDLNPKVRSCYSPFSHPYLRLASYLFKLPTLRGFLLILIALSPRSFTELFLRLNSQRLKAVNTYVEL